MQCTSIVSYQRAFLRMICGHNSKLKSFFNNLLGNFVLMSIAANCYDIGSIQYVLLYHLQTSVIITSSVFTRKTRPFYGQDEHEWLPGYYYDFLLEFVLTQHLLRNRLFRWLPQFRCAEFKECSLATLFPTTTH